MAKNEEVTKDGLNLEEINRESLLVHMLERALDDYALLSSKHDNYKSARDWIFGEPRELLPNDNREENYTLESACEFFGGSYMRVRKVALFMRRFRLSCKKFSEIYWDEDDNKS